MKSSRSKFKETKFEVLSDIFIIYFYPLLLLNFGLPGLNKVSSWLFWICITLGVSRLQASLAAQTVKNLPAIQETSVWSMGQEDPLEEALATHSSILAWRIPVDRGAWRAPIHRIAKSQTRLSDQHFMPSNRWQQVVLQLCITCAFRQMESRQQWLCFSQSVFWTSSEVLETGSGDQHSWNWFHNKNKKLSALYSLILTWMPRGVF